MTGFELTVIACGAVMLVVIAALIAISLKLTARIKILDDNYAALQQKFEQLHEHNQQELLAIGQRVLEADKIVRRFSERLDAIENDHGSDEPQYGQLQDLLKQANLTQNQASAAELELMNLLRRQQRG